MEGLRKASDSWAHRLGVQPIISVTSHEALPRLEGGTYKTTAQWLAVTLHSRHEGKATRHHSYILMAPYLFFGHLRQQTTR